MHATFSGAEQIGLHYFFPSGTGRRALFFLNGTDRTHVLVTDKGTADAHQNSIFDH